METRDSTYHAIGGWLETVSSVDSSFPSFQTLTVYAAGGGWVSSAATNLTPASLASPAYGAWVQTGDRSFRLVAHAFAYTPEGALNGFYNIQEDLELDETGRAYSSSGTFEIVDNGRVLFAAGFTSTATRITA